MHTAIDNINVRFHGLSNVVGNRSGSAEVVEVLNSHVDDAEL